MQTGYYSVVYSIINYVYTVKPVYKVHSRQPENVTFKQGRIQDFKLGGALKKKSHQAKGGAKTFEVFRVKNHDFTQKILIFANFSLGGARRVRPLGSAPALREVVLYIQIKVICTIH